MDATRFRFPRSWPVCRLAPVLAGIAWLAPPLAGRTAAQQLDVEAMDLPRAVADEVVEFFNDPGTVRFNGPSNVPPGGVIVGDVAALGGPFVVAGRIEGDLIVVNGDLEVLSTGLVAGDVTVVGGRALAEAAAVSGDLVVYDEPLRYVRRGDRIAVSDAAAGRRRRMFSSDFGWGRSRFTIRAGTSYNRVEGLPVMFGPIIETAGAFPLRLEALGVWRTESRLDADQLGYRVRLEQRVGAEGTFGIGVGAHSLIEPIEAWGLSDVETSLATFLIHRDYRDHFEREGWSLWATAAAEASGLTVTAEFRNEDHGFVPSASPWSLRRNEAAWRPQPLVAEGDLRTFSGELRLDRRNDVENPTDGWWAQARVTRGLSGELRLPSYTPTDRPLVIGQEVAHDFTHGFLDLRRYNRVSPDAGLSLRLVLAGALDDTPLPPQYQSALGGEGSLPGYRLMSRDCRARATTVRASGAGGEHDAFPAYGCDRTALVQLEYRGQLFFDVGLEPDDEDWDEWNWYPAMDFSPSWSAFVDLGRGWVVGDADPVTPRAGTGSVADAGVGLFLGDVGLFWAVPLEGEDRGVNFFIRLDKRF